MINNRTSSSGRRRGRGGSRNPNSNRPGEGNRIDSRARGNAAQLHEKYKGLARDAHNQGDRVMQEYYLQFADHYFRILSENAQRQDEYRRQRDGGRDDYDADQDEGEYAVEGEPADAGAPPREARGEREEQAERP
ncbi:MAG: DUF4167 domain-containing protein, partial [Sphingomonadaceae bacterium]|nr:DUF4167 domain-containing protein [Sphingomonadaceae bacterium]